MNLDVRAIDDSVLTLLYLTLHDRHRAWKGHDWDALNRLHTQGFIGNPVGKAKSPPLPFPSLPSFGSMADFCDKLPQHTDPSPTLEDTGGS